MISPAKWSSSSGPVRSESRPLPGASGGYLSWDRSSTDSATSNASSPSPGCGAIWSRDSTTVVGLASKFWLQEVHGLTSIASAAIRFKGAITSCGFTLSRRESLALGLQTGCAIFSSWEVFPSPFSVAPKSRRVDGQYLKSLTRHFNERGISDARRSFL